MMRQILQELRHQSKKLKKLKKYNLTIELKLHFDE
jgi:hypothetical protein